MSQGKAPEGSPEEEHTYAKAGGSGDREDTPSSSQLQPEDRPMNQCGGTSLGAWEGEGDAYCLLQTWAQGKLCALKGTEG